MLNRQDVNTTEQTAEQGRGIRKNGIRLTNEGVADLLSQMEETAEVAPELSLTPENWAEIFGENNSITTPVGQVKMGDNQITKFFAKGREKSFGMVAPTLSNPDVIIEKDAQSPNAERNTKYLFLKTFIKSDGSRYVHFETVTVRKDGMEVSISSHEVDRKVARKEMQNGIILHLNNKLSLDSERYLIETQNDGRPDLVPTSDNNTRKSQENVSVPVIGSTDVPQTDSSYTKGSEKNPITRARREKNEQEEQQQYPVDEAGEPLWYEMTEEQFDAAIAELGDTADAFIADKIKEAKKATEKAEKAKPKSTEFAKRKAEQQAISAEKAAAQKAYDYWTAQQARRIGASQKKTPQVTQQVGENITGKYQTSNRTYGNTDTYILPNGERIYGRYVIVEADAITPSHDVNNGYQKSEGFPTDENGNTINDRDYQADKSAQTIVEQNAANYDARAIQTPVIVTNQGIVLSGNGRTMSGQIAASQGTDTEYLSYLKYHAGRYGFTAEQISGYQHPRLVLEVSENVPLNAETFAKFNAEDKKTISPTEKAVKAGKTVKDTTIEKIAALIDEKDTLSEIYSDKATIAQIMRILQADGVINSNEMAELMDGNNLSAQGKEFFETLLVGKILNEQSVRLISQMKNIRAAIIKSIMPLLNNSRLKKGQNGENYSLSDEINKAIEFIYAADRANMPITDYISQTNLFDANPADIYNTATQIIAVALTKGQNNFKSFVNKYNTAAEHAASGQIDIFAGRIKTKKEILNELIEEYGNTGQAAADTQSRLGNSKVKSGIQSVRGDDAGNRGAADTGGQERERGERKGGRRRPRERGVKNTAKNLQDTSDNNNFTEKETSYERKELVGDDNRGVGEGEQRDDVQTDAGAAAVDSRVSQGDSEMLRRKVDGNRGEVSISKPEVLGTPGLESKYSNTGRSSRIGHDVKIEKTDQQISELLTNKGIKHTSQKVRLSTPQEFHAAISEAKKSNPNGWMVDVHSVDEYADCTLLITDDGLSGVAITPTGDIVSLFSAVKGDYRMQKLIPMAVALGGNKLDCYVVDGDKNLANMYSMFGFKPANKIPFNPQYAPEEFAAWAEEHPNKVPLYVATMYYVGEPQETITNYNADAKADLDAVPTIEDYDAAMQERDALLASELSKVNAANTPEADTAQPAAAEQTTETPGGRIEDYGEQIAGARKDILRDIARTVENTTLQSLISLPFSKAFKRPDLKKALESGALREKDVYFAEAVMAATLSRKKPKAGTRKDRIAKLETGKTGVESWAEEAFSGIQILQELFNAEETERDAIIKRALSVRTYGEEQVKAYQQKLEQWNPGKTFNGTAYPINQIALFYEVLRQINLGDRYDISFPVVAAIPNTSNDYYYLITPNGEKLYYLQKAKTFDNVVSQITYLTKLYNDIEVSEHPRETFDYIGREPIFISDGWLVFESPDARKSPLKILKFDTKEEAEAYREKITKENNKADVSEPVEDKTHNGYYKRYEAVFTNPITGEHLELGIEYDSKESAEASFKDDYQKLNEAANEAIAQKNAETKDNKKGLLEIIKYYDYENKKFKYGIIISDSASKNNPFDTMPLYFAEGIETKEEALSLLEKNKDDWEKKAKEVKERRQRFVYFAGNINTRIGEDYRQGKNVSAEEFATKFGFRGVQFGNWTNQEDRQAALNNAYDSFMDLSRILNVSPRALSLNGELGIAFGSRGSGKANAHYETKEVVINLTKTRGVGALAHEWWHALDNYFARQFDVPAGFATANKKIKLRSAMRDAFNQIVDNIKKSDYHSRSRKRGTYWGAIEEETARVFEEWVAKQLSQHNAYNHFLTEGTGDAQERYARMQYEIYQLFDSEFNLHKGKEQKGLMTYEEFKKTPQALRGFVYPTKEELETFGKDLDNLFDVIQERVDEETGNIALYRDAFLEYSDKQLKEHIPEKDRQWLSGKEAEKVLRKILNKGTEETLPPKIENISEFIVEYRSPVRTILGEFVQIRRETYNKIIKNSRKNVSGTIRATLENPDFVIKDTDASRLYVKLYKKYDGTETYNVTVVNKDGELENYISSVHIKTNNNLLNKIRNGAELYLPSKRNSYEVSSPNSPAPNLTVKYSKESSNVQEPPVHRTGEEAGSRDIIDMTEEELAEIRAKEREKIDRIFGKEYLDNVAKAVEKRKAERKAVVSKAARELRSELAASPDIVLVSDLKDIPEEDLQGKTPQEAIRRMRAKGWYTPGNGKVYINLSMHSTAEDVKATILHEAVAHKGLRALLGEESFGALCDAVYRSMPKKRQKAYEDTYKKIYPNTAEAELRRIIADEYMARLAEGGVRQSIPQRIISAIREFLRSIGIDLDINDADIRHLLAQSYKNMQEADAVKVLDNSALLARLRKAAEETHIKSEAESLYRLGDNNKTFSERVNRAVENKGTVMPNLAEENLKVINIPKHKYKGSVVEAIKQAEEDARKKYQGKTLYYDNYGTAFDYTISGESIEKSVSKKATDKSTNIGIHIAVLNRLDEVIANSIEVEEHPDYKKGTDEERRPENGYNANTLIHRFYGAIKIDGIVYRVKTTMKESRSAVEGNKQYSYEVTNVERLNADALSRSNDLGGLTSSREDALPLAKVIEKETKSYEKWKKVLDASREIDIRFRMDNDLEEVNRRFNEELEQQISGTLPQGHIYKLGRPGKILRSTGIPDLPIEMSSKMLKEHSEAAKHPFNISDLRNLIYTIQKPIAIFKYGNPQKSQNLILGIEQNGKNYLVGVHFNQKRKELIVSDIRGIFPKNNAEWLNWINQDKLLYADKEKIQELINKQRKTLAEVEYLDLDSIANIAKGESRNK